MIARVFLFLLAAVLLYNLTGPHEVTVSDGNGQPAHVDSLTPHGDTPRVPGLPATRPSSTCEKAQRDSRAYDPPLTVATWGVDPRYCPDAPGAVPMVGSG